MNPAGWWSGCHANFYDAGRDRCVEFHHRCATILPIDAIQEFNLEENPKAEYGWKRAVVNVGIRSGPTLFTARRTLSAARTPGTRATSSTRADQWNLRA